MGNRTCAGLTCHVRRKGLIPEKLFNFAQAPRNWRDPSQHHACRSYGLAIYMQDDRRTDFGMGPGFPVRYFQIGADRASR